MQLTACTIQQNHLPYVVTLMNMINNVIKLHLSNGPDWDQLTMLSIELYLCSQFPCQ